MFKAPQVVWFMHAVYININFWILQIVFNWLEPTEQFFKKTIPTIKNPLLIINYGKTYSMLLRERYLCWLSEIAWILRHWSSTADSSDEEMPCSTGEHIRKTLKWAAILWILQLLSALLAWLIKQSKFNARRVWSVCLQRKGSYLKSATFTDVWSVFLWSTLTYRHLTVREVTFIYSLHTFSDQGTRTANLQMCGFCPATFPMEVETSESGRTAGLKL